MKKVIFSLALFLTCSLLGYAQKGISYQAVILDPNPIEIPGQDITGQPFVNGAVSLKFKIFSSTFVQEFEEVHTTQTDAYGMVNVLVGSVSQGAFSSLVWDSNQKSLHVLVSFDQGGTYTKVSEQQLTYNPYAIYAETASKLSETLSIAGGGTGATTAAAARTNLGLGNVDNTADAAKPISTATQAALDTKANADEVNTALATKANAAEVNTALATKANAAEVNTALATKANASDVTTSLGLKEDVSNKANTPLGTSTSLYPTQNAVKTYVDAQIASATIPDADASNKGKIQLAGDLAGTAAAPTVPGLAAKADAAAVNTALNLKANTADITTALATKANSSSLSKVATSGDYNDLSNKPIFSSTYVLPTASASALGGVKVGANLSMDGTGVLSATLSGGSITGTVAVANGGTGATTLTGLVKGSGTSALTAAVSGTDYLAPNGSAANLTNFPTFNQNTTGNAANVTGTVAVSNGGTGATTLSGLVKGNGTGAMTAAVAGTDYLAPNGSAANLTNFPTLNQNTTGNAANVTGVVAVANGGTGAATLTGYVKGTGTTAMTASATIPVADVTGAAPLASPTFTGAVTAPIYATTPQALTFGSPISWNPANGLNASVTLTANGTLSFSSPPTAGAYGTLVVTQDGAGSRTLTLPTATNKVLGSATTTAIALSTAANAIDIVNFYYDGSNYFWTVGQGYGSAATAATTNLASSVTGTLPVANGGTGAATLTGLVKGNGTGAMTAAAAGTDYLAPTGSAAGLTNFPTLNQNTTGNAANVTGVVAVANGGTGAATLTGYVKGAGTATMTASATIPVADISGTLPVANGGTGAATLSGLVKGNGTGAMTAATAGTDYQAPLILTTTGTGAATLSGTTLNIPTASSGNTHYIGESYGGGIVFYTWDGGAHGLIAATSDLGKMGWNATGAIAMARANGIGAGKKNTELIISQSGYNSGTSYAAQACNEYTVSETIGGVTTIYGDWYLGSKYEIQLMIKNRSYLSGLSNSYYWSSTERTDLSDKAWYVWRDTVDSVDNTMPNTDQWSKTNTNTMNVRPIRMF